jgi:hypothetical protein
VDWLGPAQGARDAVVFAFDAHHAWRGDIPDPADDVSRLAKCSHGLPWRAPHPAHGLDCIPGVGIGWANAEFEAARGYEEVQARRCQDVWKAEMGTYPDSRTRSVLAAA